MSPRRRVVFTSSGAICGAGVSVEAIWENVCNGESSIAPLRQWDATDWPVNVASEVHGVDKRTLVEDRKLHKMLSRTDMLGLYAAGQAIRQSGLLAHRDTLTPEQTRRFNDRSGVFAGSGGGTYNCNYDFFPLLTEAGGNMHTFGQELGNTVNPMWLLRNLPNNVLCHVGIGYGFKGTNACVTNQCVGGVSAVAEAANAIRENEADRAAVTGHDTAIDAETIVNFERVGLLARNAVRPFDADRDGTVLGEGAAAFVLETLEDATARGATILAEFLGAGSTTEATGVLDVRPDGEGVSHAIQLALEDAGLSPDNIGMVVAHANGTAASDASEVMALRTVFGGRIPPVTGFKWATGHTIAASGVIDLALGIRALQANRTPGIPTLRSLDPELAPFPVSATAQTPLTRTALLICRGFGGMNVALIVRASPGLSGP
jgi:3-oxoacyl-[acyl-carrier-protein] synthase-1